MLVAFEQRKGHNLRTLIQYSKELISGWVSGKEVAQLGHDLSWNKNQAKTSDYPPADVRYIWVVTQINKLQLLWYWHGRCPLGIIYFVTILHE